MRLERLPAFCSLSNRRERAVEEAQQCERDLAGDELAAVLAEVEEQAQLVRADID